MTISECGIIILSRALSYYPERKQLLIDAGALALSKDSNPHRPNEYGLIVSHPELKLVTTTQEVGVIKAAPGYDGDEVITETKFPIGSFLKVLPNHACLTAALHPIYYVVDGDSDPELIVDVWEPCRGW